jgi:predicted RNase H-like nuclease (RuvC/YqgF family)
LKVTLFIEEDRRQHTAELKKLEKEKAEKKREITELSNTVQELIQQNQELTNAIAEEEDSILILYTDNQMALEQSVKVREELQSKKKVTYTFMHIFPTRISSYIPVFSYTI